MVSHMPKQSEPRWSVFGKMETLSRDVAMRHLRVIMIVCVATLVLPTGLSHFFRNLCYSTNLPPADLVKPQLVTDHYTNLTAVNPVFIFTRADVAQSRRRNP